MLCCLVQVEVSVAGLSLVQRSPTVCLYVCDQETPKREAKGPSWAISACERMNIDEYFKWNLQRVSMPVIFQFLFLCQAAYFLCEKMNKKILSNFKQSMDEMDSIWLNSIFPVSF
jgi:hypothetical protein